MKPIGGTLLPSIFPKEVVCHCLLLETSKQLILIDSGFGLRDIDNPARIGSGASKLLGLERDPARTAVGQIKAAGFSPGDVTDILPTHLDSDHSGGIEDLPQARVHVSSAEYHAAFASGGPWKLKMRYKTLRFSHDVKWQIYDEQKGEEWNGFACARSLRGLPENIVAVRLPGHTPGHFGIAVHQKEKWLLHAGDAYYDRRELNGQGGNLGLRLFQKVVHVDYATAMQTQAKLNVLSAVPGVEVFSAHDPRELARATAADAV